MLFRSLAEAAGMRAYAKVDLIDFEEQYAKTHILRHNFGFFEYLWYEIRKIFSRVFFMLEKRKKSGLKYRSGWLVETNLVLLVS